MDWLRRNWPDLLIGIALVAVIAGIIATLITGGSFFPVGQNTGTSTATQNSTTQNVAPETPGTPSTSANSNGVSSAGTSAGSEQNAGGGGASTASSAAGGEGGSATTAPSNGGVSVLPPNSGGATAEGGGGASSPPSTTSPGTASTAPATTTSGTAASGGQPATASNGPGSAAPYRISVGAFSHKDYAQRQEQVFKQAGYPVFLADQGDLTIVLVGPYKSQSEAEQVASKIKSGDFGVDPVVYQFQGASDQAPQPASSQSASGGAASSSGNAGAAGATGSPSASAPSGQRFLQVGAYGNPASAKPQRDRLESMGFTVQERDENGFIKLLIGPFGPDRLQQVQSQLKSAGIDSFPR